MRGFYEQRKYTYFLLKKISWPFKLVSIAIIISSLGSIIGLLVPLYTYIQEK